MPRQSLLFTTPKPHKRPPIEEQMEAAGLPPWDAEVRFHPVRKWRFDYGFVCWKVAVEIEGGAFAGGRHNTGVGMTGDIEKYNEAQILGWLVIRATTKQVEHDEAIDPIRRALQSRGWRP